MPEDTSESKEPLVLLRSFHLEDAAEEEKVDTLWRQLMVYKALAENDLAEAKSRRAQAESAREHAEDEAYQTTQGLCQRMKAEAERELHQARQLKLEALKAHQDAETELKRSNDLKAQTEKDREQTIEHAQRQAQEILDQSRASAQQEATELRRQALKEIKTVLTRVETMRAAANEELETQRILSNVAKLKATSRWILSDGSEQGNGSSVVAQENAPSAIVFTDEHANSQAAEADSGHSHSSARKRESQHRA